MPLYARVFSACVVGYAFSSIDLSPAPVLAECREKAQEAAKERLTNRVVAAAIVAIWLSLAALAIFLMTRVIWALVGVPRGGCYDPRGSRLARGAELGQ